VPELADATREKVLQNYYETAFGSPEGRAVLADLIRKSKLIDDRGALELVAYILGYVYAKHELREA
jgi:ubiquinone biosynthesis protein Coq4